jgi:hypothetical protein
MLLGLGRIRSQIRVFSEVGSGSGQIGPEPPTLGNGNLEVGNGCLATRTTWYEKENNRYNMRVRSRTSRANFGTGSNGKKDWYRYRYRYYGRIGGEVEELEIEVGRSWSNQN